MPENATRPHLARAIDAARAWADLSREQVGVAVGVSGETIGRWERGEWKRQPPRSALLAIADLTGVPAWFLLEAGWQPDPASAQALLEAALEERARQRQPRDDADGEEGPSRQREDL